MGTVVRVGGHLSTAMASAEGRTLTTTDGGALKVLMGPELIPAGTSDGAFVEIVGTRAGAAELRAVGVVAHGGQVDAELWDEAVKLMHVPQLQDMFAPASEQRAMEEC